MNFRRLALINRLISPGGKHDWAPEEMAIPDVIFKMKCRRCSTLLTLIGNDIVLYHPDRSDSGEPECVTRLLPP